MLRHKGKRRTYVHNLKLASLLSFVAGIVNVTGVLSLKILTTNVTGHFAYFAEELFAKHYAISLSFLLFIFAFLLGAFLSNCIVEIMSRINPKISYAIPILLELIILTMVAIFGSRYALANTYPRLIACLLLFAMGVQNSLVTQVSQSVVRTTHLTGLFTDLGIELSQLFFYRKNNEHQQLSKSIYLRLIIIGFFFLGCIIGGYLFKTYELKTLLLASLCLIFALYYDVVIYQLYVLKRNLQSR